MIRHAPSPNFPGSAFPGSVIPGFGVPGTGIPGFNHRTDCINSQQWSSMETPQAYVKCLLGWLEKVSTELTHTESSFLSVRVKRILRISTSFVPVHLKAILWLITKFEITHCSDRKSEKMRIPLAQSSR